VGSCELGAMETWSGHHPPLELQEWEAVNWEHWRPGQVTPLELQDWEAVNWEHWRPGQATPPRAAGLGSCELGALQS
jgi:hypothetical protein